MNTSKNTDSSKAMKNASAGTTIGLKGIIFGAIAIVLVIAMVIGMAFENFKPQLVMTVGDEKGYMKTSDSAPKNVSHEKFSKILCLLYKNNKKLLYFIISKVRNW